MAEHGRNVVDGFQFRGNLPGGFKKQFSFIGEAYTAVLPAEDGKPQFLFQILDAYAKVRLQHLQVLGRLVDGTAFHDFNYIFKIFDIHR